MTVVYTGEQPPAAFTSSILLVGPTHTTDQGSSWHNQAIKYLEGLGYQGVVFVPEPRSGVYENADYAALIAELEQKLQMADVIVAWIDRTPESPGLTSSAIASRMMDSGKLVFGAPQSAQKTRFLRHWAEHLSVPAAFTLEQTIANAIVKLGKGALRRGGERFVPPFVWHTPHFQQWYTALQQGGNRLDYAEVVWSWRVGPRRAVTFFLGAVRQGVDYRRRPLQR